MAFPPPAASPHCILSDERKPFPRQIYAGTAYVYYSRKQVKRHKKMENPRWDSPILSIDVYMDGMSCPAYAAQSLKIRER